MTRHNSNGKTSADSQVRVVVVGCGQAGLCVSHFLQQRDIPHIVLERDRPFSAWAARWDGFRTNTPNWMNTLPVLPANVYPSDDPTRFATRQELLTYLEACLQAVNPPLRLGVSVERVVQHKSDHWEVQTDAGNYRAESVVICNGAMSNPAIPAAAEQIGDRAVQLHSSQYVNPTQIETPNVLVVGSASSGVQICRLLAESGRFKRLAMAVSKVMTLPDRILGIQTHKFLHTFGLFDIRSRSLLGRLMYSGLETKGDPIMRPTPRDLAKLFGVELYGRFAGVEGDHIRFQGTGSMPLNDLTIIWCTGFRGGYSFISVNTPERVFNKSGAPIHVRGVVDAARGLYFVGLRYQHTVASHDIYGVGLDADYVVDHIHRNMGDNWCGEALPELRRSEVLANSAADVMHSYTRSPKPD